METSFNSFIISANKSVSFQNLYCANNVYYLSAPNSAMEIYCFRFQRRYQMFAWGYIDCSLFTLCRLDK